MLVCSSAADDSHHLSRLKFRLFGTIGQVLVLILIFVFVVLYIMLHITSRSVGD